MGGRGRYNRSQILYRIAEMLEGRAAQFVAEMVQQGVREADGESGSGRGGGSAGLLRGVDGQISADFQQRESGGQFAF